MSTEIVTEAPSELRSISGRGAGSIFGRRGEDLVIILAGGDKSGQERDIKAARKLWDEWKGKTDDEAKFSPFDVADHIKTPFYVLFDTSTQARYYSYVHELMALNSICQATPPLP